MESEGEEDGLAASRTPSRVIPIFYDGYELRAWDFPLGRPLSCARGELRGAYRRIRHAQPYTGFYTALRNLVVSLRQGGHEVRVNDFSLVRRSPDRPIGIAGHKSVWDRVTLPNPALFGPGWVPPPDIAEERMDAANIQIATHPSDWPIRLYPPVLAQRMAPMFVGIDTVDWPSLRDRTKTVDCLIYNKIRWSHAEREADTMQPLRDMLDRRGLVWRELFYGRHDLTDYRRALAESRALVFCTEHETQGLAYQEAMSSDVPVFAWDEGLLIDPPTRRFAPPDLVVSAVPYFDERCGERWTAATMEDAFETFWTGLDRYRPRSFVQETLALEHGARRFLDLFSRIG